MTLCNGHNQQLASYHNPIRTSRHPVLIIINQTSFRTLIPSEQMKNKAAHKSRNQTLPTTPNLDCMNFL